MSLPGDRIPSRRTAELREHYRAALFDDVVPWWMRHSLDRQCGGYYSLLERDGRPWATDKYMWMNGRQVWLLSHLYNAHEQNPEWLEAARLGAEFMLRHAFKDDGKMHFRLSREGQSRSEALSLYTEVFGAIALAEYSRASGDESCWAMDGSPMLDLPEGRMFHPGHAIESAWMLMEIAQKRGDERLLEAAIDIVLASLEHGWDDEYGGIRYLTNVDWTPTHSLDADMKLWWPHGEALYALLLA